MQWYSGPNPTGQNASVLAALAILQAAQSEFQTLQYQIGELQGPAQRFSAAIAAAATAYIPTLQTQLAAAETELATALAAYQSAVATVQAAP
ncbi:hypothetical protein D0B32_10925 [Paraburkholderia sp. DHOC27]|nr:hypothetical protein D0B32_10925 [Paraburkholderia sp. DHOC27]